MRNFRKRGVKRKPPVKFLIPFVGMLKFCTTKLLSLYSSHSVWFLNALGVEVDRECGFYEIQAHTSLFPRHKSRVKLMSEKQQLKPQKAGQKVRNREMGGSSSALLSILFHHFDDGFNFWVHPTTCWDFPAVAPSHGYSSIFYAWSWLVANSFAVLS